MRQTIAALTTAFLVSMGLTAVAAPAQALDDGLALTPPMGFNNWNSTHCRAEFNEAMVKGIADIFVSKGLKDAGYQYVNLDDCWALPQRDADGNLVPDPKRFPDGIKALADYVHDKGLKLGIYTSAGTKTCNTAGFPGGLGHEEQDANLFASWGIDYLKYDNCNNQGVDAVQRYTKMRDALKATGRPIVFSICEWGQNKPWLWGKEVGHLWRTTGDINDTWPRTLSIIKANLPLAQYAGPGHWNDPDMLEVGNGGMTDTEYRTHFGMWAIMAAPLLIGSDLRKATPATYEILENREVIAIDQDPLGVQGAVLKSANGGWVVVKPLKNGDEAVALFNETDKPQRIATSGTEIGLDRGDVPAYRLRDLWAHTDTHTEDVISAAVPPHGTVLLRVSVDHKWNSYPPALGLDVQVPSTYPGGPVLAEPGKPFTVTASATDNGHTPAQRVELRVQGPEGWDVTATSPTTIKNLPPGASTSATWQVTPPATLAQGQYTLGLTARYTSSGGRASASASSFAVFLVPPPPPTANGYLSDLPWLSMVNGWGPVERDRSNGEKGAADGHTITINGAKYAKGLGAHAPSTIEYYLGGHCTTVTTDVGLDDEKGSKGTVSFEIWANGDKVADSGVMTNAMPAKTLTADVSGATLLRLVVTDGGDGVDSDHGDWAGTTIACA
ncbi:NPCBM/NEW2 domain-containing protein [Planotetraspora sp. GP83]|uniref:NPCBM/NEW2 domain-containing protein n=1 Tax=Planotetraspora sp. GP83 TaxID=3156264 RepID=UPI0035188615